MLVADIREKLQCFFLFTTVESFHHFFEGISGFTYGGNNNEDLFIAVSLQNSSYIFYSFNRIYTGPTEFEYFHTPHLGSEISLNRFVCARVCPLFQYICGSEKLFVPWRS